MQADFDTLTRAREFRNGGKTYLAEFNRFAADRESVLGDGPVIRAWGLYESIDVSRGDGSQFAKGDAERQEAQQVAIAYCASLKLTAPEGGTIEASFREAYADRNSEWSFTGVCSLPATDPRAN